MVEDGMNAARVIPSRRWPGLRMLAAVRMAFDGRKLILAAAGIILLQLGWSLLDLAFPDSAEVTPDLLPRIAAGIPDDLQWTTANLFERLSEPARILLEPLLALLDPRARGLAILHALLGLAWLIVVWGFLGGAIARIAVAQEAGAGRPGIAEALRFARRSAVSLILAPIYPLLGVVACLPAGLLLGLVYRIPSGATIAGVLLFIPLLLGLVMTLLIAALVAGWPMFHAALASGADDALDALSRTYSYLNQRLILFGAGVAIAGVAGIAGLILVDGLAAGVLRLTRWSLSLTGPRAEIAALFGRGPEAPTGMAAAAHAFWLGVVRLLAGAWAYSYFWSAAAVLYLWLRREVDGTPTTELDRSAGSPPGVVQS